MGNISSYLQSPNVVTQCIRKRKTSYSQQLMDIDSDSDFDDDEKIIFYSRKDDSLKKKKKYRERQETTMKRWE